MYRFEKVYVDLITEDRTVCVGYWTVSELLGKLLLQGMVEVFRADGRHEVVRVRPSPMPISPLAEVDAPLRSRLPEGEMTWEFDVTHGGVAPTRISGSLDWRVEFARARMNVRWPGASGRPVLRGVGYADRVRLRGLPRRLGLSSLRWGRVHLPDETLVFTQARFYSGRAWNEAIRWSDGPRSLAVTRFELEDLDDGVRVAMPGRSLTLRHVRVLHEGPAIDSARFPHGPGRFAMRALAGPTHETRWLARAEGPGRPSEGEGWGIHEHVLFGSRARRRERTTRRHSDEEILR